MPPAVTILERRALPDARNVERLRVETADGARTTVHTAAYPSSVTVRLARLDPPTPVLEWAESEGVADATNGGFLATPDDVPLGEFVTGSGDTGGVPFAAPWSNTRACLRLGAAGAEIGPRDHVMGGSRRQRAASGPAARRRRGAGRGGTRIPRASRRRRTSSTRTSRRTGSRAWRSALGAASALNLDGGSSSALVAGGELRNTPRDDEGNDLAAAGPTTTAIVFDA